MLQAIVVGLKIIMVIFSFIFEKNAEKKKAKKEGLKVVLDGIEKSDPAIITSGFDDINNA